MRGLIVEHFGSFIERVGFTQRQARLATTRMRPR
jgi:hypothetical protein